MATGEGRRWLTMREAAARLGVSFDTVKRWAAHGAIQGVQLSNGYWRFAVEEIERKRQELEAGGGCS